ncbi:type I-A CRISPR-associated protein Cas7/Csa2 [Thermofilum pendens]|uniref:CRISPR-associated autoregulator, DevR family n=1 Tax=Thermofilum pendens (strain DSM 2475 / Hrk 5) TaxID=368408 RepID=A1RZX3_THEPD|nr:type I-A CRISPR-associated protein Cas7/Csa2 [Thermofilum pendens]ABL78753.1 CRISPR-associated autoregulator, DevR family [Thermofilum pendens Hrk 5]
MVYVRVTGRAIVNVHSANAEGAVGNYTGLSRVFVVKRRGSGYEVVEEPVISGNMVKHWHAVRMVEILKEVGGGKARLCDNCKRFIMYRSTMNFNDEFEYVKACAIEDVHGFLQPDAGVRRESLVKFSFMVPVEELDAGSTAVTHNRVFLDERGSVPREQQAMMVFKREHASGLYGFSAVMDLKYVGRPLADPDNANKVLPLDERRLRAKAALLAMADVLSGRFGAASARALPIVKVEELVCAVGRQPIPSLVHGFYSDYAEESYRLLRGFLSAGAAQDVKVFVYGRRVAEVFSGLSEVRRDAVKEVGSPVEAFVEAAKVAEEWLS